MNSEQSILKHNTYMEKLAKTYAAKMALHPSPLEDRMANYFNIRGVDYVLQKPFFIMDKNGKIVKFFIADFYIPSANLIVEVDGKFHKEEREYDELRDDLIKEQYKGILIIRLTWQDLDNVKHLNELFQKIFFASNKSPVCKKNARVSKTSSEECIMIFFSDYEKILGLTGTELKLLLFCWAYSIKNIESDIRINIVYNDNFLKEKCHKEGLTATDAVINNTFSRLHRKGFLLKLCRGVYAINPLYAYKGTLTERNMVLKRLLEQGKIEMSNGNSYKTVIA